MEVGGYTLDLYCDHSRVKSREIQDDLGHTYDEFPHQFYGETHAEATKEARSYGWTFHSNGKHSCAKCKKRGVPERVYGEALTPPI